MHRNILKLRLLAVLARPIKYASLPLLLLALSLSLGCSGAKSTTRTEPARVEKTPEEKPQPTQSPASTAYVAQNEDFDPLLLKAPEFRIARKPTALKRVDTLKISPAVAAKVDTSWQTVPGYQVQLLQTEDAKQARATVREAVLALNVEVETFYEAPYYKIRAGRFVNRYDAEQLQNLATDKGYVNCWVIRTQIKVRADELLNQKNP